MDFGLDDEQRSIVDTVRRFVDRGAVPPRGRGGAARRRPAGAGRRRSGRKALEAGLYAANMPEELGGGGLDAVGMTLVERELGKASYALQWLVARPSNILQACEGDQRERYLLPAIRGERLRLPGDDRARRRLRRPVDDDAARCATATTTSSTAPSTSSATPTRPTS